MVLLALESTGNILRMMLGGTDEDEEDIDELKEEDNVDQEEGGGSCGMPPPVYEEYDDLDLDEIEGRMEDTPLLGDTQNVDVKMNDYDSQSKPELEKESKPALDQSNENKGSRKPKLAGSYNNDGAQLAGGRGEQRRNDKIAGFQQRQTRKSGGGQLLGGGGGGSAGLLA